MRGAGIEARSSTGGLLVGSEAKLTKYWTHGAGADKIGWNRPGDFLRCVALLTPYVGGKAKGMCNHLHQLATGGPPGHGSAE